MARGRQVVLNQLTVCKSLGESDICKLLFCSAAAAAAAAVDWLFLF